MGGVVKTGEKIMGSDSVYVTDLDVSGIPDGIIKLTVQLKDSLDQLLQQLLLIIQKMLSYHQHTIYKQITRSRNK